MSRSVVKGFTGLKIASPTASTSTTKKPAPAPSPSGPPKMPQGRRLSTAGSAIASSGPAYVPDLQSPTAGSQVAKARRRLSISADPKNIAAALKLDGSGDGSGISTEQKSPTKAAGTTPAPAAVVTPVAPSVPTPIAAPSAVAAAPLPTKAVRYRHATLSKVGFVPFNPNKVNQDRFTDIIHFGQSEEKAFFGVFDGHGTVGHDVSSWVSSELPKYFLKQKNLDSDPRAAITKAFVDCNTKLAKGSGVDCAYSGTTCIVVYIHGRKLYSCNAGDSRAVLAKRMPNGQCKAVPLSSDHKPERADEKKRILECKGRVEACKGPRGEDIGPARVWLLDQDVPGLAMTRSFGDLVAASVGVIPRPEVWDRTLEDNDSFMILASDGVWEFISSQEAVDIVAACSTPEQGCKALVEESNRRWAREEEVVDDTTAVIVYFV